MNWIGSAVDVVWGYTIHEFVNRKKKLKGFCRASPQGNPISKNIITVAIEF